MRTPKVSSAWATLPSSAVSTWLATKPSAPVRKAIAAFASS
jgi:hypothetical protein